MTDEIPAREPREDVRLRTRAGDASRWTSFRVWWKGSNKDQGSGRDLVVGIAATFAAVVCTITAPFVYALQHEANANAKATATAAREGCLRSQALGPSLALDYRRRHVLTVKNQALYESLIPTTCPKP